MKIKKNLSGLLKSFSRKNERKQMEAAAENCLLQ
jgi:hypothetical protein